MATSSLADETILIVEDNETFAQLVSIALRQRGATVLLAETLAQGEAIARGTAIDLALLDLNLPDGLGTELLAKLHADNPDLPVIMLTGYANVNNAVEAMKLGAVDFLQKPFKGEELDMAIERAMALDSLRREIRQLRRAVETKDSAVRGNSEAIQAVWKMLETVAPTDANILITGENGTGKEVLARAIHAASRVPTVP